MKKLIPILIIGLLIYGYIEENPGLIESYLPNGAPISDVDPINPGRPTSHGQQITRAFQNQQSDVQVSGSGRVVRTLSDDNEGSRHQRFILEVSPGLTILVAHNIDLAPRINSLHKGDAVSFYGEYEWNAKGGVLHWTHHDPGGRHAGGWLKHDGKTYQ